MNSPDNRYDELFNSMKDFQLRLIRRLKKAYGYEDDDALSIVGMAMTVFMNRTQAAGHCPRKKLRELRDRQLPTRDYYTWLDCLHNANREYYRPEKRRLRLKLQFEQKSEFWDEIAEDHPSEYKECHLEDFHDAIDRLPNKLPMIAKFLLYDQEFKDQKLHPEFRRHHGRLRKKLRAKSLREQWGWSIDKWNAAVKETKQRLKADLTQRRENDISQIEGGETNDSRL